MNLPRARLPWMRNLPRLLSLVVVLYCALGTLANADEPNLRLRMEWGGDPARQWEGKIEIVGGEFSQIVPLSLDADAPGQILHAAGANDPVNAILAGGTLEVRQTQPRRYDGVDVTVEAPLTSQLTITLTSPDDGPQPQPVQVTLEELLRGEVQVDLDNLGSRLLVRRAPGDALRVLHDHPTLIFAPGEQFSFRVDPHHAGLENNPNQKLRVRLVQARTDEELRSSEVALVTTPAGDWPPIEQTLTLPTVEGVYDIVLGVERPNARLGGQFLSPTVVLSRRVQVVVLAQQAPRAVVPAAEEVVAEIDPANPDMWDRLRQSSQLRRIPGIGNEPAGNDLWKVIDRQQKRWIELEETGWIAYPLPIGSRGKLHVLEIEYPNDIPQTLGVSIVELNAAGEMVPPAVDSAVYVPPAPSTTAPGVRRQRVYFWPRSESPMLLLTNRDEGSASFGRIRILTGPAHLPPAASDINEGGRQALAVFDRPLYPEIFSAGEGLDHATGRSLDDWKTYLEGGNRMCEYLAHAGFGGAMIAATCEGSSLYPSDLLRPTPKYDLGVFFANGQHAQRKDVLELLYRQFDRHGQTLVPIVQFTTPLPRLEDQLREENAAGIALVDLTGATWVERKGTQSGLAPYYNPLDPRVQQAMREVVSELVSRYGNHAAFGGVSLQLSAEGFAMLPGADWGCDDITLARFADEQRLRLPAEPPLTAAQREQFLAANFAEWKAWRAEEMTAFYEELAAIVTAKDSQARLYLSGSQLIDRLETRLTLRPTLPHVDTAPGGLLNLGIDAGALSRRPGIVLLRPRYYSPLAGVTENGPALEFNRDNSLDDSLGQTAGASAFHAANVLSLPAFDEANPLGATEAYTYLMPIATPSGDWNRQRFIEALAARDTAVLTDGGWSIPLGQIEELADFFSAWRRLPRQPFETPAAAQASPLVLRTLRQDNRRYVYILNNSRWSCTARLEVSGPAGMQFVSLHNNSATTLAATGDRNYTIELPPFGMVAGYFTRGDAEIRSVAADLPPGAQREMAAQVQDLKRRLGAIPTAQTWPVANGSFEQPDQNGQIPQWNFQPAQGVEIRVDPLQEKEGSQSLLISSTGPVAWVQSDPLGLPNTGRVSVSFALRTDNPSQQPPLRLAIFGTLHGRQFYKFASIGADQTAQLRQEWHVFELQINDLPPEGVKDLRIELDLMGPGKVWVDDIRVEHIPFSESEQFELSKIAVLAEVKLRDGNVAQCAEVLEGYWPRFLDEHLSLEAPQVAAQPLAPIVPREAQPAEEEDDDVPVWQRLRMPRLPRF